MHDDGTQEPPAKTNAKDTKIDDRPFIQNNSDKDVLLKPGWEGGNPTIDIDGTVKAENGAYILKPGYKTHIDIDGLRIDGNVYKVTNGYTSVVIGKDNLPTTTYSNPAKYTVFRLTGGWKNYGDYGVDGTNWDKLFLSK